MRGEKPWMKERLGLIRALFKLNGCTRAQHDAIVTRLRKQEQLRNRRARAEEARRG